MSILIYIVVGIVVIWFVKGVFSKLNYYRKVERSLRKLHVEPKTIEVTVGKQRYINAMSFLKLKDLPPETAASLLKFHVLINTGEFRTFSETDPFEYKFLELLGLVGTSEENLD